MPKKKILLLKTEYLIGDPVPASAIYECSLCEQITAFKKGEVFLPCETDHPLDNSQHWHRTNQFVHFVSRNLNTEFAKIEGISLKLADVIAEWAGSMWFVAFHIFWFWFWMYVNTGTGHSLLGITMFDPYPFGLLTMIVSLEAIFLSTFILVSQNRQSQKSELRAELDYQTNLKTEKDVAEVLSVLREMREEGHMLSKETKEVIEDAKAILEEDDASQQVKDIIEDAGIDIVDPAEEPAEPLNEEQHLKNDEDNKNK